MEDTETVSRGTGGTGRPAPCLEVVRNQCDGVLLSYDRQRRGVSPRGSSLDHIRGMSARTQEKDEIRTYTVDGQACPVICCGRTGQRYELMVAPRGSAANVLLSARGRMVGDYGCGIITIRIHPALINRIGVNAAIAEGRAWMKWLWCGEFSAEAIISCECVSQWDHAIDIMITGNAETVRPSSAEQVVSRLRHREQWYTGWRVGLIPTPRARQRLVVLCYEKLTERRVNRGAEGVRGYLTAVSRPDLQVHADGTVTQDGSAVEVWRLEARFHRHSLHAVQATTAGEAQARIPNLVRQTWADTVMREGSGAPARRPLTPVWRILQEAAAER